MNFKVGQRVRKVARYGRGFEPVPIGTEGVITGANHYSEDYPFARFEWRVDYVGFPDCIAATFMLAPLTDPRASEFIGDMERFSKLAEKVNA